MTRSPAPGIRSAICSTGTARTFAGLTPQRLKFEINILALEPTVSLEMISDVYKIESTYAQNIKLNNRKTERISFNSVPGFSGAFKINYRINDFKSGETLIGNLANGFIK